MKIKWKELIISLAIPLAVGGISAFLTRDSMKIFETLNKPPLSPPPWIFPVVWTLLYVMMGIACYLVYTSNSAQKRTALLFYGLQLVFNFFWPIFFFNLQAYFFSFIWLLTLWILILVTLVKFYRINENSGLLLVPYLVWVTFAGYLNLSIAFLN